MKQGISVKVLLVRSLLRHRKGLILCALRWDVMVHVGNKVISTMNNIFNGTWKLEATLLTTSFSSRRHCLEQIKFQII